MVILKSTARIAYHYYDSYLDVVLGLDVGEFEDIYKESNQIKKMQGFGELDRVEAEALKCELFLKYLELVEMPSDGVVRPFVGVPKRKV